MTVLIYWISEIRMNKKKKKMTCGQICDEDGELIFFRCGGKSVDTTKNKVDNSFSQKIIESTVANLLCYIVDNHENRPLNEEQLQEIGSKFLVSDYNKDKNCE